MLSHQWLRGWCEEHRARPTMTNVDAAGDQHCSPGWAGRRGTAAPCCADIDKQGQLTQMWYILELAASAVPRVTVTHGQTSDACRLAAPQHSAPSAACRVEQLEVLPVWRFHSQALSAPMQRRVTARLGLAQTAGCCEVVICLLHVCNVVRQVKCGSGIHRQYPPQNDAHLCNVTSCVGNMCSIPTHFPMQDQLFGTVYS